jgi:hypothetical protein
MTTTNNQDNESKKASKPRLKRIFRCQIELGPYPDTDRRRYVFWCANVLLTGRWHFLAVVQLARNPKRLGDEKRNPVLYRHLIDIDAIGDPMDVDKLALISGGNALYHIIEPQLRKVSRPLASVCGWECNGSNKDAYWHTFETGHGTEQLALWRSEVLYVLEHKYQICDQTRMLNELKELYGDRYGEETFPRPRKQLVTAMHQTRCKLKKC